MAESRLNRIIKYFEHNKKHIFSLLKSQGNYVNCCKNNGYLYEVKVGEYAGTSIFLRVGLKSGNINILSASITV